MPEKKKLLVVFEIEESDKDQKYWHEVGVAFENRDGSLNVKHYMLPLLRLQDPPEVHFACEIVKSWPTVQLKTVCSRKNVVCCAARIVDLTFKENFEA